MSEAPFRIPDVGTHLIASKNVDQVYRIDVMLPLMRNDAAERFPALYLTDGNLCFDTAKGISHLLQICGQLRRCILIGIGYPGSNPFAGSVLRCRDFISRRRSRIPELPRTPLIEGVAGIAAGKKSSHGAAEFLAFIREELVPFVDEHYPTVPGDRSYAGYSMGGGLGLHALFSRSDLFRRYLLVSPSISFEGEDYGIDEATDFIASRETLDARVFMAVGELEELDPEPSVAKARFVSSVSRLAAVLRRAQLPGLDLHVRIFPGETHASVWPVAFTHGLQFLYGPADRAPLNARS